MRQRLWTEEEVNKLYEYSTKISQKEAAEKLNRSYRSIRDKAKMLKIKWACELFSFKDIAKLVGCHEKQVSRFAYEQMNGKVPGAGRRNGFRARISAEDAEWIAASLRKKLAKRPQRGWTKKEKMQLYSYAGKMSMPDTAKALGRTVEVVLRMSSTLGIKWRQGTRSLRDVAREAGVSVYIAKKALKRLYPGRSFSYSSGFGKRYIIGYDEAEHLVQVIKTEERYK